MNIIRAEKKYIGQMAEIEKECFTDPWSEAAFESSVGSQAEIILAAEENGKIAGYIIGNCDGHQGYIEKFCRKSSYAQKGHRRQSA
ncbi:MAG: GNAT family N-acetyltransferase [Ruminococcus sp.]|nr:MAG: GNAT family N-acetyltransferase [Ruminococcus sp.]